MSGGFGCGGQNRRLVHERHVTRALHTKYDAVDQFPVRLPTHTSHLHAITRHHTYEKGSWMNRVSPMTQTSNNITSTSIEKVLNGSNNAINLIGSQFGKHRE